GIRDFHVTGVQTCALPICAPWSCSNNWSVSELDMAGLPVRRAARAGGYCSPLSRYSASSACLGVSSSGSIEASASSAADDGANRPNCCGWSMRSADRSEEHTSELQSRENLVCRLLLEKKKNRN